MVLATALKIRGFSGTLIPNMHAHTARQSEGTSQQNVGNVK